MSVASRPEDSRVCHRRHDRSRPDNPDARDGLNPLARLVRAMLHLDPLFDRSDDTLQRLKLRSQHDDAGPCIDRQPRVLFVRHDCAQFVDPGVALRRHDAELSQMRPQGVDDLGALAYQHIARAVLHQLTLLFGRFDPHKAHGRSPNRFADRLGVSRIVFVALDVGLHILRRHQAHLVAELRQLARPIMRRGTGFHADQARRQCLEKRDHSAAPELLPRNHLLLGVDPVNLKYVLGDIYTDRGNLHLDGSPHVIRLRRSLYGTSMPGAGAVHHIRLGRADHLPGARIRGRCSPVSGPISVGRIGAALGHKQTYLDWQKSNPQAFGSATQSQASVRHITLFASKIMVVCRISSTAIGPICWVQRSPRRAMRNILWAGITAVVLSLGLADPVAAAPFEDGLAAYRRGDYATAMRLWRSLADQGNADAQSRLGFMYQNGRGVPQDDAAAVSWYRKAADQGNANAQVNLGFFYDEGRGGLQKDDREATRLYKLAADQGNADGQNNLGVNYRDGLGGVSKDDREAARLFKLAAVQGNANAQVNLGLMYAVGWGVQQDDDAARVWFNLAAAGGLRKALTSREAAKMTPEQIAEADQRFAEWLLETFGLEKRAALPASPQPTESAHPKPIVIADDNG